MKRRVWRHRAEYVIFRLLICVLHILSPRGCARLAECLAYIIHSLVPRKLTRYEVARQNIETAFPGVYNDQQIDRLIHDMWVHLFRMVAEMVQLPRRLHEHNFLDWVHYHNRPEVLRALCSGRPILLLGGHFGNWEIAISMFGMFGFPMGIVARELDNPYLNEWFRNFRQQTGHCMIAKKGGSDEMLEMFDKGGHLALLGDQDAGPRGVFVNFFGKPASTFKSIALLALQYRALICVGYARRLPDDFINGHWARYELGCEEIIDPQEATSHDPIFEVTQRYSTALENVIRRAPEQYFWVHRRWKSAPKQRQRRAKTLKKAG